jgi:hypothetical protein
MFDPQELRKQLYDAQKEKRTLSRLQLEAREKVVQLERQLALQNRVVDSQMSGKSEAEKNIRTQLEQAQQAKAGQQRKYTEVLELENSLLEMLAPFNDPREHISQLDGDYSIFLLPLRVETRFRLDLGEMWVRVFPDDCAVDPFEETLAEIEVKNAETFWKRMWAAGGDDAMERAAWRNLVSSHGSGRARWIINHYGPQDQNANPIKKSPSDVILVVPTRERPGNDATALALLAYWTVVWLADGKVGEEASALEVLQSRLDQDPMVTRDAASFVQDFIPFNLDEKPSDGSPKQPSKVSAVFIEFPKADTIPTKRNSWSQPAQVHVLPDCLVLLGFNANGEQVLNKAGNRIPTPLVVSPDPLGSSADQFKNVNGDLTIPDDLRWMVEFQRAIDWGLGFRVTQKDLSNDALLRDGFQRLMVLGVRLNADPQAGKQMLQTLLQDHHYSNNGFGLLPQGTATNNTEATGAGFSRSDDADETFEPYVKRINVAQSGMTDGALLAESLGLETDFFAQNLHAHGTDQWEARLMNRALFPGTLGYTLEAMLGSGISTATIRQVQKFFNDYVRGRGSLPAIRIGNQPYGILPTTVFSRINWFRAETLPDPPSTPTLMITPNFLEGLYQRLRVAHTWWKELSEKVDYIGKEADTQKILLNILGLYPSSVEYHSRYAESIDHLYNITVLQQLGADFKKSLETVMEEFESPGAESAIARLQALGYTDKGLPDLLKLVFWTTPQLLKGPVIDDRPLSETEKVRAYTAIGEQNYLAWLAQAAQESLDTLRIQAGFKQDTPPQALLYIVTRYALMMSFWKSGVDFQLDAGMLTSQDAQRLHREPSFIHIQQEGQKSESRWAQLYAELPAAQDRNATVTVEQLISRTLKQVLHPPLTHIPPTPEWTVDLAEQVQALEILAELPTARLERLFAEHLDCCSYRLDAWELGLVQIRLDDQRARHYSDQVKGGIYLGAYGWLENVVSESKNLTPVTLSDELQKVFDPKDANGTSLLPPLLKDDTNGGYIHAPSLNQAVTAAILRSGYLSNNLTKEEPQPFAVNLTSERVRVALAFIEGIRNGQSLGALLGYQLERGLHDRYQLENDPNDSYTLDEFIFKLRKAFPLQASHLKSTSETKGDEPDVSTSAIESMEARNVIDGLTLVENAKNPDNRTYPFGKKQFLPDDVSDVQKEAINAEVKRLMDIYDSLADLALAESIHQSAQGNYDRASATLDAYGKSSFPPIPDVIQTPRSGTTLTHRVGLQLEAGLPPDTNPVADGISLLTPRGIAEPALNKWLADLLPDPENLVCKVTIEDPVSVTKAEKTVSWQELQVQPIDLLYLLRPENEQAMSELDDRIVRCITADHHPRPDARIEVRYTDPIDGKITFFQLAALIHSLRSLLLFCRPLQANDVMLLSEAAPTQQELYVDPARIRLALQGLEALRADLDPWITGIKDIFSALDNLDQEETVLLDEQNAGATTEQRKQEISTRLTATHNSRQTKVETQRDGIETDIGKMIDVLERASRFGIPQTGWGFIYSWKAQQFSSILEQLHKLVERWDKKLDDFDDLKKQYNQQPATAVEIRSQLIHRAELLVSTKVRASLATFDDLDSKHALFVAKRDDIRTILSTTEASLPILLSKIRQTLTIQELDWEFTEVDEIGKIDQVVMVFTAELLRIAQMVAKEIDRRIENTRKKISEHDASVGLAVRAKALLEASQILLGDEFHLIPEFILPTDHRHEWAKALDASGNLLKYLTTSQKIVFPVDNWLYGLARVREKLRHWEHLIMLVGAIGKAEPELTPIQLPYKDSDSWLALDFPQDDVSLLDGDHLLYTAHYAEGFDRTKEKQCGLLLDEWTEKLPGHQETTGITFHFDRPNSEPSQTMLLVNSPNKIGSPWVWQDLVEALNETLELAKIRAVEPAHIEEKSLNRLLPASLLAFTLREISISANLSKNNQVMEKM